MALSFRRREDFATTLDNLYECMDRGCFTVRHVALTSDFLLGFHAFLEDQIISNSLQMENNMQTIEYYDTWDDLEYYNSIEVAINKQHNHDIIQSISNENTITKLNLLTPSCNMHKLNIHSLNALEFWNCVISDDITTKQILSDIIMVFPEISTHKFEKLKLSFNFLDDETLDLLTDSLIYLYDLNELKITNNDLTYLSFSTLNNIFNHRYCQFKQTIKVLDLSGNDCLIRCHENGLNAFKSFVDELLIHSNITYLRLAQLSIKNVHIQYLGKWIIENHETCTLNKLDLSETTFDLLLVKALCDEIMNNEICRLQSLVLKNCTFTHNAADYFGSHLLRNYCLYELDLSGIDLEGFISFANSSNNINISCLILSDLQCRSQPNWYKLKMDDISDALIKIITKKCLYVDALHLNRGDLNNDEVMDLCAFLCNQPWIRTLVLSNNFITNECIKSLSFCVGQTKKECVRQTKQYCNNIVYGAELLLFGNKKQMNHKKQIECNDINVHQLINAYLSPCCECKIIPSDVINLCVKYFYPKLAVLDNINEKGDGVMDDLFVNFNYPQFPYDLAMIILQFVFFKPMNGLKSVLLSGNSLHPTFSACFRNTELLSKNMLHKISLTKSRYNIDPNETTNASSLTFGHSAKFVKTMY